MTIFSKTIIFLTYTLVLIFRCQFDLRIQTGQYFNNAMSLLLALNILFISFFYMSVYVKLRKVAKNQASGSTNKYQRSIRNMLLFMAAYIASCWPYIFYGFWSLFGQPHLVITVAAMIFFSMSGTFNFLVYIVIHRKLATTTGHE